MREARMFFFKLISRAYGVCSLGREIKMCFSINEENSNCTSPLVFTVQINYRGSLVKNFKVSDNWRWGGVVFVIVV